MLGIGEIYALNFGGAAGFICDCCVVAKSLILVEEGGVKRVAR
jgi:hypothetical protein